MSEKITSRQEKRMMKQQHDLEKQRKQLTERDRGRKTEKNKKKENRNVDEGRKEDNVGNRNDSTEGELRILMHQKGWKNCEKWLQHRLKYYSIIFLERSWNIADMSICIAGSLFRFRKKWQLEAVLLQCQLETNV